MSNSGRKKTLPLTPCPWGTCLVLKEMVRLSAQMAENEMFPKRRIEKYAWKFRQKAKEWIGKLRN